MKRGILALRTYSHVHLLPEAHGRPADCGPVVVRGRCGRPQTAGWLSFGGEAGPLRGDGGAVAAPQRRPSSRRASRANAPSAGLRTTRPELSLLSPA